MKNIIVSIIDLTIIVESIFICEGLSKPRAKQATEALIYADLAGLDTHGVLNLISIYVEGFRNGAINPQGECTLTSSCGAVQVFDAQRMLGLCAGRYAMKKTIECAKQFGVAATTVRNSTHFGAAGYYASMALKENMIGIAMTNLGAKPVAHVMGSQRATVGTNPISMAAPVVDMPDFVLDMSTTVCASGKIKQAREKNTTVPNDWLLDETGQGITNPEAYFSKKAFIPTIGGWNKSSGAHKGFGLNLLVEVLCGVLANADLAPLEKRGAQNDIGHFFIAMDISAWCSTDQFQQRMAEMLNAYLAEPVFEDFSNLSYPGYPDVTNTQNRQLNGMPLPESIFNQLNQYASKQGLTLLKEKSS